MNRCPLCEREGEELVLTRHHLKTRRKDKHEVELICSPCHKTIHALFDNPELRDETRGLDTVEGLRENPEFAKALAFIAKQPVGRRVRVAQRKGKRRRR
ncbi:MAG: HNH endonuclease [Myxococcota bacterium]